MKKFALIFRMNITDEEALPTPDQMKVYMKDWMEWTDYISSQGRLAGGGNHFSYSTGKVIRPQNVITDGPYTKDKESIAGYILITAENIDGAVLIAKKCPILFGEGTSVEVREVGAPY